MKQLKTMSKRGLALFIALMMCLGMLQISAFASEEEAVLETTEPVEDVTSAEVTDPQEPADLIETEDREETEDPAGTGDSEESEDPAGTGDSEETEDPAGTGDSEESEDPAGTGDSEESEDPAGTEESEETKDPAGTEDLEETEDPAETETPAVPTPPASLEDSLDKAFNDAALLGTELQQEDEEVVRVAGMIEKIPYTWSGLPGNLDRDALAAANQAYQALTEEQKVQVQEKLKGTTRDVDNMNTMVVRVLNSRGTQYTESYVTLRHKDEVNSWLAEYAALSQEQKQMFDSDSNRLATLQEVQRAKQKIDELDATVNTGWFSADFADLKALDPVTESNMAQAEELADWLEEDIQGLSTATVAYLTENGELQAAKDLIESVRAQIEALKSSAVVDEAAVAEYDVICKQIYNCIKIDYPSDKATVKEGQTEELRSLIRQACELAGAMNDATWNAAWDGNWAWCFDYGEQALGTYDVAAVNAQIAALPAVGGLKLEDGEAVRNVRAAYNALSAKLKKQVTGMDKVENLELALSILELSDLDALKVTDADRVGFLRLKVNTSAAAVKAELEEAGLLGLLAAAEAKIEELKEASKSEADQCVEALASLQAAIDSAEGPLVIDVASYLPEGLERITASTPLVIPAGKTITLTGTAPLTRSSVNESLIRVERGGTLTLENITLSGGGEVAALSADTPILCEGALNIEAGAVISGFTASQGGAVCVQNGGALVMNGGEIRGNTAKGHGGGVLVLGDSTFTMNGGAITGNDAWESGGGISLGTDEKNDMVPDGNVNLAGGVLSGNNAGQGGGIYVSGFPGNGLSYLTLKNVQIADNGDDGQGGGIWFCNTGLGKVYATSGGVITGNHAAPPSDPMPEETNPPQTGGADFATLAAHDSVADPGAKVHLPTHLPNGKPVTWTNEKTGEALSSSEFHSFLREQLANHREVYLTSRADTDGITSSLVITKNTARQGGGIACNGSLQIGEDRDLELVIVKEWRNDTAAQRPKEIVVQVLMDGEELETVTLTAENGWRAVLSDLPAGHTYTVKELSGVTGYQVSYPEPVTEGRTTTVTIVNTLTPAPTPTPTPNPGPDPDPDPDPTPRPTPTPTPTPTPVPEEPNPPEEEVPDEDVPRTDEPDIEVPDEEIPLANVPEEVELPEEEVPLADVPETGDESGIWLLSAVAAGASLLWLLLTGRKRKEDAEG